MTTRLTKPLAREVVTHDGQPLIVTFTAAGIELREKRRRVAYLLPYGAAFVRAATLTANQSRPKRRAGQSRRASRSLLRRA